MTLTKAELVKQLVQRQNLSHEFAIRFVETFFAELCAAMENGEDVKLINLGNFNILQKKARWGRNPKTGEPALIAARRVVTFTASRKFQAKITELHAKKKKI